MPDRPLVVFCFDAADPELLVQWAGEGHLPALERVMNQGWWGQTSGPELTIEHGAWVSLLSGRSRAEHGYHYFRQLRSGSYELRLVGGHEVDAPPFWAHLTPGEASVAVIDVPDVRPIPGLEGVQLSDWAVHNPEADPSALPETVLEDARRVFGPQDPIAERLRSTEAEDRAIYERLQARVSRKGTLVRHLVGAADADLVVVGFGEAHTGGHQFWRYRPGNLSGVEEGPLTHATRTLYQAIDRELGLLLEAVGPANVVVLSSVGMRDQFPMTGISETFFRELGYQASPPPAAGSLRPLDLARRLLPESVRVALSRFLPRERREGLLADQFRSGTDWARTTAFSIPSAYATFVRVNLQGREPEGTVTPQDYPALLDRIEADFLQLTDPDTGEPVVESVQHTRRVFGADASENLPDLIIHWRPLPRFLHRVVHPRAELTQDEPEFFRDSDHTRYGWMAAAGPAFEARGDVGELDALDVAPTLWAALGGSERPDFPGSPRYLASLPT